MQYRHIKLIPTGAALGAEVIAGDLRGINDRDVWREIYAAWSEHLVIFFRGQSLSPEDLAAITLRFGPDFGTEPFVATLAEHPHVMEVRREKAEKASPFGAAWHSDWSFQERPAAATLLYAKIVPPVGGDTLYTNGYAAYEALSAGMKRLLEGVKALHSARMPYSEKGFYATEGKERAMKILPSKAAEAVRAHPIIRTHPDTGRKALFVNPVYTVGIEEMSEEEARPILCYLFAHSVKPEFQYRHKWEKGMLTVWDNRCTQHMATGGYDGHERLMHRTTSAGTVPA